MLLHCSKSLGVTVPHCSICSSNIGPPTPLFAGVQRHIRAIYTSLTNSFIGNYEVGICEVTEMDIVSLKRVHTFDEWVEKYKPIKNQFEETSFEGCVFDYSEDDQWEFVKKQNPANIWTMVDSDDCFVIIPGCHWVNRESYFITEKPVEKEDLSTEFLVIE